MRLLGSQSPAPSVYSSRGEVTCPAARGKGKSHPRSPVSQSCMCPLSHAAFLMLCGDPKIAAPVGGSEIGRKNFLTGAGTEKSLPWERQLTLVCIVPDAFHLHLLLHHHKTSVKWGRRVSSLLDGETETREARTRTQNFQPCGLSFTGDAEMCEWRRHGSDKVKMQETRGGPGGRGRGRGRSHRQEFPGRSLLLLLQLCDQGAKPAHLPSDQDSKLIPLLQDVLIQPLQLGQEGAVLPL